jgi:hypothetical protein
MAIFKLRASTPTPYTLTGAHRDAKIQYNSTTGALSVKAINKGGVEVVFPSPDVAIKGVRLSDGGLGLVAGERLAAELVLIFGTKLNTDAIDETIVEVPLAIGEWNRDESQALNAVLKATTPIYVFIKADSIINISDFNVQDDWVGQEITPILELEIETDHLLTTDGEVVF